MLTRYIKFNKKFFTKFFNSELLSKKKLETQVNLTNKSLNITQHMTSFYKCSLIKCGEVNLKIRLTEERRKNKYKRRNKKECFDFLNGFFSFFITVDWTNKFSSTASKQLPALKASSFEWKLIECVLTWKNPTQFYFEHSWKHWDKRVEKKTKKY